MKMKRHRQPLEVMASMNITNILDTAFILLFAFMIVAPQLAPHSIEITIPPVDQAPQAEVDDQHTILIVIQKKKPYEPEERIYIDKERVDLDTMVERILEKMEKDPKKTIYFQGDEDMSYGMFIKFHAKLSEAHIEAVSLDVKPSSATP